jgi:Dolichyl-phosphate-mannose-protein mannosyltransferase
VSNIRLSNLRWIVVLWAAWLCATVALTFRPFLGNLDIFRQVDRNLYLLMLVALGAAVPAAVGYHFLRRRSFWRREPLVLPIAFVLLCAIYSPGGIAVTLWMLAAAFATGKAATEKFGLPADLALSTLAGFGIFSVLLFILGMSHAFYPWVFALLFTLPIVVFRKCFRDLATEYRDARSRWIHDYAMTSPHVSVAVFAAIILALIATTTSLTPAWNGDSIEFHLPLMRVFLSTHDLTVPAAIPYGYYPQGFEVLAAAAFALAGQTAAQFVNPAFFCLAILALYRIARYCGISRSWAVAGVILGVSIPFVHWTGSVVKNDFPLVAYQFAALLCYFRWRETTTFRWILLSGFFIAMSFGIKHVAVFGAVPWALASAYSLWRDQRRFSRLALLGASVLVLGLFWQARAYWATGHPLFPFIRVSSRQRTAPAPSRHPKHSRWLRMISAAYDVHFQGKTHFESPTQNPIGIVLLLMAPLCLIPLAGKAPRWTERTLWLFVILFYPLWVYYAAILRYAIAPVLLLAVLGTARMALFPRPLAITAMGAALLFSIPIIVLIEMAPAEIPLFLKQIDTATFLRRTLPPYGAVEFLNQHASASDSIASVGDWAAAYAPNPAKFHLFYLTRRYYQPSAVYRVLQSEDRYLILPNSPNLADLESAASEDRRLTRLYQDPDFVVDALAATGHP